MASVTRHSTSSRPAANPPSPPLGGDEPRRTGALRGLRAGHSHHRPAAINTAAVTSTAMAPACIETSAVPSGAPGAAPSRPVFPVPYTSVAASRNGTAPLSTHITPAPTDSPRRRARAIPSMVAPSTGRIKTRTSSRTAQAGMILPSQTR